MGFKPRRKPHRARIRNTHYVDDVDDKDAPFHCQGFSDSDTRPDDAVSDDWDAVDCLDCLGRAPMWARDHYWPRPGLRGKDSKEPFACGATEGYSNGPEDVTCIDCKELMVTLEVSPLLEHSAEVLFANALTAAKQAGFTPVQKSNCACRGRKHPNNICLVCALVRFRDLDRNEMAEEEVARVLGVPYDWTCSVIDGWDCVRPSPPYIRAARIGRRLWRRHGAPRKAKA